jgi:hypothetical protein
MYWWRVCSVPPPQLLQRQFHAHERCGRIPAPLRHHPVDGSTRLFSANRESISRSVLVRGDAVSGRSHFSPVAAVAFRLACAAGLRFARALGFRGARDFVFFPMHSPLRPVVSPRTLAQVAEQRPLRTVEDGGGCWYPSHCPCPWPSWLTQLASGLWVVRLDVPARTPEEAHDHTAPVTAPTDARRTATPLPVLPRASHCPMPKL